MKLELIKEVGATGDIFYNIYKDGSFVTGKLDEKEAREIYANILKNEFVAPEVLLSTEKTGEDAFNGNDIIRSIEGLYPIDSNYVDTGTIGEVILMKAIRNIKFDWRMLPNEVLCEYNQLCLKEENSGDITAMLRKSGRIVDYTQ